MTEAAELAVEISEKLWPLVAPALAGLPPNIQGAVLADLTATWLAGHRATTQAATRKLRREMLNLHIAAIWDLIPVNEARGESHGRSDR